jgi:FkbM family methyltransferase
MQLIIDAGCNLLSGYRKLTSLESISAEDRKIFLEANPECWDLLDKYIAEIPNSKLFKKALDTEVRAVELITRADECSDTAATILGQKFIEQSLNRWNIKVDSYNTYRVETITLERIIAQEGRGFDSVILKLDAEGIEYQVLPQILELKLPINKVYCEFHVHSQEDEQKRLNILHAAQRHGLEILPWD